MFTGIIENKGVIITNSAHAGANRLVIIANLPNLQVGESIAVNGVCLTLLPANESTQLCFDISPETLRCTNIGSLSSGDTVNLERAMHASTRFGGHYVSGHVDTTVQVSQIIEMDEFIEIELSGFTPDAMLYLVPKGSITVDGVSLTINTITKQSAKLMLVPHTLEVTTLGGLKVGQIVNIEFDYLARVVAHQLQITGKLRSIP